MDIVVLSIIVPKLCKGRIERRLTYCYSFQNMSVKILISRNVYLKCNQSQEYFTSNNSFYKAN